MYYNAATVTKNKKCTVVTLFDENDNVNSYSWVKKTNKKSTLYTVYYTLNDKKYTHAQDAGDLINAIVIEANSIENAREIAQTRFNDENAILAKKNINIVKKVYLVELSKIAREALS